MGFGQWTAYLIVAMKQIELIALRVSRLETLEPAIGRAHDHDGGDGSLIPEAGLHADVVAQLVTNGDTHDHIGGDGAEIDTNALANLAVTAAKLATAVQNELVTNGDSHDHIGGDGDPIDTDALASKAVTQAKIDDLAVDTGQLVSKAVTQAKIDDLAVDTGQIASNAITNAKMDNLAVDTAELASKAVTQAKIDDLAVDTGQLAAGAVELAKLGSNSVDDTKAGNRVPQFYRRKGGSSSNWATPGSSSYTPGAVRMQGGSVNVTISAGNYSGSQSVSFPTSFNDAPLVIAVMADGGYAWATVYGISSSGFTVACIRLVTTGTVDFDVNWLAIGPE